MDTIAIICVIVMGLMKGMNLRGAMFGVSKLANVAAMNASEKSMPAVTFR